MAVFKSLATFDEKRSRWIVGITVIFVALSVVFGTGVVDHLSQGGFEDKKSESYQAELDFINKLDSYVPLIVLFDSPQKTVDNPAYQREVERVSAQLKSEPGVRKVTTYYTTRAPDFVSRDRTSTYAAVTLAGSNDEQLKLLEQLRPNIHSDQLEVKLGGPVPLQAEISEQISQDLAKSEMITFPLLAILLILVFRGLVGVLLPLLLGGVTILGAFLVVRLISEFTDLSVFALNIITVLGLGLAIDYSLFIVSRFREELRNYRGDKKLAIEKTLKTAGRTVFFSGITVMISLLALLIFPVNFLVSMGIGGAAAVLVAMIASLTFLPAVLYLLGTKVNALSFGSARRDKLLIGTKAKLTTRDDHASFWYRVPRLVMKRPVIVMCLTLVPLILAGLPFLHVKVSSPDYRALPESHISRQVSESLVQDFAGEGDPIQIVFKAKSDILAANLPALRGYVQQLETVPGTRNVHSVLDFVDQAPPAASVPDSVVGLFVKDNYALIKVSYSGSPDSDTAQQLVRDIRAIRSPPGVEIKVGGSSAEIVDLINIIRTFIPYGLLIIVVALSVLLFLMLGSVVIPLKAIILNILSLSASFGALVWVFQEGHLANLLGFTSTGSIDATQPILIFAIAFGLSMDYAVFLLSRIREEYNRSGDNDGAIALGIQKTGPIITSAAVLLVVVIASFGTGEIPLMKQIAVGLGLAVIIDAIVIRMLLVPATMHLLGGYNWWAPGWLKRVHARLGLSE